MSKEELIKGCLKGKGSHFSELYDRFSSGMYSICLRYAGDEDEAKDLLQEGFLKIFQKLGTYDTSRGSLEGWIKRIFINLCIDFYRKNKYRNTNIDVEEFGDEIPEEENEVHGILHDLTYDELISEISKLPPGYRTVFNMHVIDGKGHKEIATELEITESTSKTQLFKARNLLKKNLMAKTLIRTK